MTQEVPKLDVQTLEYVVSILDADKEAYRDSFYKTDTPVKQSKYRAIGNYITFLRNELKTIIEEQQEDGE